MFSHQKNFEVATLKCNAKFGLQSQFFYPIFWHYFGLKWNATLKPSACTHAFFSKILWTIAQYIFSYQKNFLVTICNRKEYISHQSSVIILPFFRHFGIKKCPGIFQIFVRCIFVSKMAKKW